MKPVASITADHLNVKPNFGVGSGHRGIPVLRWDNELARSVLPLSSLPSSLPERSTKSRFKTNSSSLSERKSDGLGLVGGLNDFSLSIVPCATDTRSMTPSSVTSIERLGGNNLVSILSSTTHISLNPVKVYSRQGSSKQQPSDSRRRPRLLGDVLRREQVVSYDSTYDSVSDRRRRRAVPTAAVRARLREKAADLAAQTVESWLLRHASFPDGRWTVHEKADLKRWFDLLDVDGSGEVGADELADPLLSTGVAESMQEVRALIATVDKDGSGEIGFDEFLRVMKPKKKEVRRNEFPEDPRPGAFPNLSNISPVIRSSSSAPSLLLSPSPTTTTTKGGMKGPPQSSSTSSPHFVRPADVNPIAALQRVQRENGGMDMSVVVAMQRRKILMDAIIDESQRRELEIEAVSKLEREAKFTGKNREEKNRLLHSAKTKEKEIAKSMAKKQNFIEGMKVLIDKNKAPVSELAKFMEVLESEEEGPKVVSLAEAIDKFNADFDLTEFKARAEKRAAEQRGEGKVTTTITKAPLRGIASRGEPRAIKTDEDIWYTESTLKAPTVDEEDDEEEDVMEAYNNSSKFGGSLSY